MCYNLALNLAQNLSDKVQNILKYVEYNLNHIIYIKPIKKNPIRLPRNPITFFETQLQT